MLGKYIKINNTLIPNPNVGSFKESYPSLENVITTEAGTRRISVVRLNRYVWTGEFNVSSRLKATLLSYALSASVTCEINGVSKSGTLRVGDITLYPNSEYTRNTDGLWTMQLTFEEF